MTVVTGFLVAHPLLSGIGAAVVGFGISAFILRFEIRYQVRSRRHRGYLIGGR